MTFWIYFSKVKYNINGRLITQYRSLSISALYRPQFMFLQTVAYKHFKAEILYVFSKQKWKSLVVLSQFWSLHNLTGNISIQRWVSIDSLFENSQFYSAYCVLWYITQFLTKLLWLEKASKQMKALHVRAPRDKSSSLWNQVELGNVLCWEQEQTWSKKLNHNSLLYCHMHRGNSFAAINSIFPSNPRQP